jgi:predicted ATP-binding protein involved in virulence
MPRHHTRKAHHSKSAHHSMMDHPLGECCDMTFHGIHHWYKHMFEHLGWMILAKDRGMTDKTTTYLNSLKRLKMAIEQKLKSTRDHDKKEDLKIMHHNVCILMEHAEKDL